VRAPLLVMNAYWNRNARRLLVGIWLSLICLWHPKYLNNRTTCRHPWPFYFSTTHYLPTAGGGYLRRHFFPQTCVVTTPQTKADAMIAAWHPKLTPGPVAAIHFNWK